MAQVTTTTITVDAGISTRDLDTLRKKVNALYGFEGAVSNFSIGMEQVDVLREDGTFYTKNVGVIKVSVKGSEARRHTYTRRLIQEAAAIFRKDNTLRSR